MKKLNKAKRVLTTIEGDLECMKQGIDGVGAMVATLRAALGKRQANRAALRRVTKIANRLATLGAHAESAHRRAYVTAWG